MSRVVKVITDSTADLPPYVAEELGIVIVPLTVKFGDTVYLDGRDMSTNDFYDMLVKYPVVPTTAAPSPGQFLEEYDKAASEGKDILSLHISRKLSGTYDAALLAKGQSKSRVEIQDSQSATMGLGLLAIHCGKLAQKGADLDILVQEVSRTLPRIRVLGMVDTLEYLKKGGRIGRAQAFLGSLLNIKPLLSIQNGETFPLERVRTRGKAIERLWEICKADAPYEELSILYSTIPELAEEMMKRFEALFSRDKIYKARFGPILGTHIGPGSLGIAYIKSSKQ